MLTLASINAFDLYKNTDEPRYAALEALIRGLDADVIAVQELHAAGDDRARLAAERARRLAAAVDRRTDLDGDPVVAVGGGWHHVALLWRPQTVTAIPGTVGRFERDPAGMWHSLVTCVFEAAGRRFRVGSVQLSPWSQDWALRDAQQILRAYRGQVPGWLGGDFNGTGANTSYDPDPYAGAGWAEDHVHQLDDDGHVDRRGAPRLEARHLGRMRDCALLTGAGWRATVDHRGAGPARRVDRWYVTHRVPAAAVGDFRMIDAGSASDHRAIVTTMDPAALPE